MHKLIEAGADIDARDKLQRNALLTFVESKARLMNEAPVVFEAIQTLLDAGIDRDARDSSVRSAVHCLVGTCLGLTSAE